MLTVPACAVCLFVCVQGYGNQRFVFQGVHETICYGPSDKPWGDNEPRINQIVFIGRKLDRKALMEGFRWVVAQLELSDVLHRVLCGVVTQHALLAARAASSVAHD